MSKTAQRKGGFTKLTIAITKEGTVKDVKVIEMQPKRAMKTHCLLSAIRRWKFKPKVVDGVAVEATGTQILEFAKQR